MNERIQELKQQAADYVDSIDNGIGIEEYRKLLDQKFAELIVKECAELCSTHEMADEPFGEKSYRKGHHFDVMIRQHFGVES